MKTNPAKKMGLDEQVARYVYATNTSFRSVEHPQFKKLMDDLRPGYVPPTRLQVAGPLLDTIYEEERGVCKTDLEGKTVSLGLDGWSNVHNEPVICVTLTTVDGEVYLVDTVDSSGHSHTGEYLCDFAYESIQKCEKEYNCKVGSVVTDNAANVSRMRTLLQEREGTTGIITFGCSAHILNLLAGDLNFSSTKEQVIKVVKYFRNNHIANSAYRATDSPKLSLPSDVRWNSVVDCFESYLKGWSSLIQICEEKKDRIDKQIQNIVVNISIKRNVEDIVTQLKPISIALDKMQASKCSLSDCVQIWKELEGEFVSCRTKFKGRYTMAIQPCHLLTFLLDPHKKRYSLSENEKEVAMSYAEKKFGSKFLALIIKLETQSKPFNKLYFSESVLEEVSTYEWYQSQKQSIIEFDPLIFSQIEILLTAVLSTASVERVFSTYGLVQSKLRNKLGLAKAAKLVFLFKRFNSRIL